MKRCALLGSEDPGDLADLASDDRRVIPELAARGWRAEFVQWDRLAQSGRFDAVVIRSTWDYHLRLREFVEAMASVTVPLANSSRLVAWNADKRYLESLDQRGVPVLQSEYHTGLPDLEGVFRRLDTQRLVAKPCVGASAHRVFLLERGGDHEAAAKALEGSDCLIQPFIEAITRVGETSLVYFGGEFSHAINKVPRPGEYRVQEELGGVLATTSPSPALVDIGRRVMESLPEPALYARVDVIPDPEGPRLMEVELIEPALYLGSAEGAASRFAVAIDRWFGG